MEKAHLEELIKLEENYWWHVAKRQWATELLIRYAPPPGLIVEGGIGAAGNLKRWNDLGYQVAGLDSMPEAVDHAVRTGLPSVLEHDLMKPWPIERRSSSAVVLLDVLEHLPDPVEALRHAAQCLDEQGKIIFTVPAYPWLFSDWDRRLGHYRRYTSTMLKGHAEQAGFKVIHWTHWNSFTLPAACAIRLVRRWIPSKRGTEFPSVFQWINRCLILLSSWERRTSEWVRVPVGLSLVGVLGK